MNKILVAVLTLLFVSIISCKENVDYEKELKKVDNGITDSLNALKIVEYKEIKLECIGEEFSASKCVNEEKTLFITFDKKFVSFSIDSTEFIHQNIQFPKELGYESFLFFNKNDKIIILNFFLENGANIYVYRYHENELKFLGHKEIILDENEENEKTFSVEQIEEEVIVSLGKNIKNLHFKFANAIDLKGSSDLSLSDKMKANLKTPAEISSKLILTRDVKGKLNIDTGILAYISKYTTSKNNTYVLFLEEFKS